MYNFNAKKVKNEIVEWIKLWFEGNGPDCKAVIGISGGIDSSTVAALCVEALGRERVYGVLLPNGEQSDIEVAYDLVDFLKITSIICNIENTVNDVRESILKYHYYVGYNVTDIFEKIDSSEQAEINLPARIRMATLYYVSQCINGRVINTCNLSESYCGYDTVGGDSLGDMSPLKMLTKTEVRAIARELGLLDEFVNKIPTDGLCGKTDEENFGFTYEVLDRYIRTGEIDDLEVKKKIDDLHQKNLFKLQPMAHFEFKGE